MLDQDLPSRPALTRATKKKMQDKAEKLIQDALLQHAVQKENDSSKHSQLQRKADLTKKVGMATCSKNVGGRKNMHHYSRGHVFIVSPCGHIYRSSPLYGSESPSQVFVIMMDHLCQTLQDIPEDEWHKYSMVYDNMCHVDDMIVARSELPTETFDGQPLYPAPFNSAWLKINKCIDRLHISNHKNQRCQNEYHPNSIVALHPESKVNTMRAEETFVWLSRYKKILCATPKTHHQFVLHRLIVRRNAYTYWKRSNESPGWQSSVIGPKARSMFTT